MLTFSFNSLFIQFMLLVWCDFIVFFLCFFFLYFTYLEQMSMEPNSELYPSVRPYGERQTLSEHYVIASEKKRAL